MAGYRPGGGYHGNGLEGPGVGSDSESPIRLRHIATSSSRPSHKSHNLRTGTPSSNINHHIDHDNTPEQPPPVLLHYNIHDRLLHDIESADSNTFGLFLRLASVYALLNTSDSLLSLCLHTNWFLFIL